MILRFGDSKDVNSMPFYKINAFGKLGNLSNSSEFIQILLACGRLQGRAGRGKGLNDIN